MIMPTPYARLDFAPGWQTTNDNLIELVDLFDGDKLDWIPREGEWPARAIFAHIVGARYHGPIATPEEMARLGDVWPLCRTPDGIKQELRSSWEMLARFLRDPAKLDAVYDDGGAPSPAGPPPSPLLGSVERAQAGMDLGYVDQPDRYSGHYIAYHRFAHDLHHRSTLIGYLSQLGVTLDGRRIRPL
jgi:hypothetical protein